MHFAAELLGNGVPDRQGNGGLANAAGAKQRYEPRFSQSVADLVALARQKPGELNYVTLGVGSTPHLSGELFSAAAGIKTQGVPYKLTTQAYTDLMEGRIQFWIASMPSALPHVQSGKLRALAVAGTKRSAALPEVQEDRVRIAIRPDLHFHDGSAPSLTWKWWARRTTALRPSNRRSFWGRTWS